MLDLDDDWQAGAGLRGLQHSVRARWCMPLARHDEDDERLPPKMVQWPSDGAAIPTLSAPRDAVEDEREAVQLLWVMVELGGEGDRDHE